MYCIHFTIIKFYSNFDFFELSKYKTFGTILAIVLVVLSSAVIAIFTYNIVEKKGIALGNRIIQKIENKIEIKKQVKYEIKP